MNAIRLPSGDQSGRSFSPGLEESLCWPLPSAFISQSCGSGSASRTYAILRPFGESAGKYSCSGASVSACWAPPATETT